MRVGLRVCGVRRGFQGCVGVFGYEMQSAVKGQTGQSKGGGAGEVGGKERKGRQGRQGRKASVMDSYFALHACAHSTTHPVSLVVCPAHAERGRRQGTGPASAGSEPPPDTHKGHAHVTCIEYTYDTHMTRT